MSLPAGNLRRLEGYLYNYAEVRREIGERIADLATSGSDRDLWESGIRRARAVADPTPTRAALLGTDTQLAEWRRVLAAIDAVREDPTIWPEKREVLLRWYGLPGRPRQHWRQIADALGLSRATVFRYREELLGRILWGLHWLVDFEDGD